MDVIILDHQLQTVAIIDDYQSLQWTRRYSEVGEFAFYAAPEVYQYVQKEYFIYLNDTKEIGLIENMELTKDQVILRGRFYDCIYDREIAYPTEKFYSKYPEQIIYALINKYFPNVETPETLHNYGTKITTQYTGKSILEIILDICGTQDLGFMTTLSSVDNMLHFSVFEAKNRLPSQSENTFVDFSENFGTLEQCKLTYDVAAERNYALVAGQDSGNDRVSVTVDWRESESDERKMLFVDARDLQQDEDTTDAQYLEILRQRGREKLLECVAVENIEVTPVAANLIYQTDYDIGDLCAVDIIHKSELNDEVIFRASLSKRITELTEVYEGGYQTLHLTLGKQYQTISQAVGGGGEISSSAGVSGIDIDTVKQTVLDTFYPVGSIYMSTASANPSTYMGGTWTTWGSGRVPVGVNVSDNNFNTVEKTGGASTVTLTTSQMPSHNHSLTINETSLVGHFNPYGEGSNSEDGICSSEGTQNYPGSNGGSRDNDNSRVTINATHTHSGSVGSRGDGAAHNNLQPYITCYMWKRTA